jgi:hypothetical protein
MIKMIGVHLKPRIERHACLFSFLLEICDARSHVDFVVCTAKKMK